MNELGWGGIVRGRHEAELWLINMHIHMCSLVGMKDNETPKFAGPSGCIQLRLVQRHKFSAEAWSAVP